MSSNERDAPGYSVSYEKSSFLLEELVEFENHDEVPLRGTVTSYYLRELAYVLSDLESDDDIDDAIDNAIDNAKVSRDVRNNSAKPKTMYGYDTEIASESCSSRANNEIRVS